MKNHGVLNDAQIDALADKLNAKVNIPIIGEETEKKLLVRFLVQMNGELMGRAGEELRGILSGLVDGSKTGEEAAAARAEAVAFLNARVDLPIVGEDTEAKLLGPVVDGIVDVLKKQVG